MTCPSCDRPPMEGHPGGALEIKHDHATCELLAPEDATRAADHTRYMRERFAFTRPATDTERQLLAALGYRLPDTLNTDVEHLTPGVRRRTWDLPEPEAE